ncbi:MAG: UDP-N-acetylmuramoylalanine--D-glutamate ligase, partial [Opitutales bacterium]|nr:UDP-N-acetylmuramoylalanine--D-glutamate ligase [Opitutales bacterium]
MTKNIKELCASKPAAIFGTGASGAAAKRLFDSLGIESVFYAESGAERFDSNAARRHALVVYSPAFRPDHPWIAEAEKNGCLAICEPDLSALAWRGKIYAVTGTNGKTTITKFLTRAFSLAGFDAVAAGNVGKPLSAFCAELDGGAGKIAVCELSSFQTSNPRFLKPDALLWTNFAPDHLDWHKNMREYFFAKFNIVEAALGKPIVAGSSVARAAKEYGAKLPEGAEIFDESLSYSAPEPFSSSIQARNFAMAEMFAKKIGLSRKGLLKAAESFSLPEYRFSAPEEIGGIRFYNDSKATNAHAAIAALEELAGENDL